MDFECHITVDCPSNKVPELRLCIEGTSDWTFSCISGDPVFGDKVFCYATAHFANLEWAMIRTNTLSHALLNFGFNPIRRKIEQTMSDERLIDGKWTQR